MHDTTFSNRVESLCSKKHLLSDLYEVLKFKTFGLLQYSLEFYDTSITAKIYISYFIVNSKFKWAVLDIVDYDNAAHSERLPKTVFHRVTNDSEYFFESLERWLTICVKP